LVLEASKFISEDDCWVLEDAILISETTNFILEVAKIVSVNADFTLEDAFLHLEDVKIISGVAKMLFTTAVLPPRRAMMADQCVRFGRE